MSLVLRVDGPRWRAHLHGVAERFPGLVPVAKGNGYGFGLARLARRAQWLGVDTVAVGLYEELPHVHQRFDGDLLVLSPWRPHAAAPADLGVDEGRVVHSVGRLTDLAALAEHGRAHGHRPRVVLERITSMLRHGMTDDELAEAAATVRQGGVRLEGVALHLPLPPPRAGHATPSHVREVEQLLAGPGLAAVLATTDRPRVWVSHLDDTELETLALRHPGVGWRPRVGTSLWLGERAALRVTATVLDAHAVQRGDAYGYRQRTAPRRGTVLVVSGGTSHGVGLEAPTGQGTLKARAATLARGSLDAAGFVRSPYVVGGKHRLFAEPPHMQVSMLFLPHGAPVPEVGEEIEVRLRYTTTAFDRVEVT